MKKERPKFYALYKDFNGTMRPVDVLSYVFEGIFTKGGKVSKKVKVYSNGVCEPLADKSTVGEFVRFRLREFRGRCQWELGTLDWPYRTNFGKEFPKPVKVDQKVVETILKASHWTKVDVYQQLEPNMPIIIDLVWNYLKDKIQK